MKKVIFPVLITLLLTACAGKPATSSDSSSIPGTFRPSATGTALASPSGLGYELKISEAEIIKQYLSRHLGSTSQGGRVFVAYEQLSREQKEGMDDVYLWAVIEEYYKQNNELKKGSGSSIPTALILQDQGDGVPVVTGHKVPGDGSAYTQDLQKIFPEEVRKNRIFESDVTYHNQVVEKLQRTNEADAKDFFANDNSFTSIAQAFYEEYARNPGEQYIKQSVYVTEELRQKVIDEKLNVLCSQSEPNYVTYQEFSGLPGLVIHQYIGTSEADRRKVLFKQVGSKWKIDSITCEK